MTIYFSVFFGNRGKAPQQGRASSNILREYLAETRDTAHRAKSLPVTCAAPCSMPKWSNCHQKIKLPIQVYSCTQQCAHHVESPKFSPKLLPIGKYRMLSYCHTSPGRESECISWSTLLCFALLGYCFSLWFRTKLGTTDVSPALGIHSHIIFRLKLCLIAV